VIRQFGFATPDSGELENAAAEAALAFSQGEEPRDFILLARARLLRAVLSTRGWKSRLAMDPAQHASLGRRFRRDAVEYARQTQDPRLLARACVWQGLTFAAGTGRRSGSRPPLLS
jgi:hypothetical protein